MEILLPNNTKVFCIQKEETYILYEQIQGYFKNGIQLHEGDTVVDVGANIGLFTLWVYQACNKNISVYAFEPVPEIFKVLEQNTQRYDSEKLKALPYGISQIDKTQIFGYYPNATALSTAYPDSSGKEKDKIKRAAIKQIESTPSSFPLLRWLPHFLLSSLLEFKLKQAFQMKEVVCQLKSLSNIIHEYNIPKIDLLKIDAEKSELDVILGIKEQDWSLIKQVVIEVHDINCRVQEITNILEKHGFNKIIVEQEPIFKGSDTYNIYALKSVK